MLSCCECYPASQVASFVEVLECETFHQQVAVGKLLKTRVVRFRVLLAYKPRTELRCKPLKIGCHVGTQGSPHCDVARTSQCDLM